MEALLIHWVGFLVPLIEGIGILIVVWAVAEAVVSLARRGRLLLRGAESVDGLHAIRLTMGERLVLALEFFLAGDIVRTILVPTWESLAILGGIVAIRTVLVLFLHMELKHAARAPGA